MKPSALEKTLAAAHAGPADGHARWKPLRRLTEGVMFRDLPTHVDERGSVVELFDPRWQWHPDPFVFAYALHDPTGYVKGWNLHKEHEDRYCLLYGEMELVLYDPRPDSQDRGEVCRISLNAYNRRIVNVPRNVWHADHNIGTTDAVVVNFPTHGL